MVTNHVFCDCCAEKIHAKEECWEWSNPVAPALNLQVCGRCAEEMREEGRGAELGDLID